MTYPAGVPLIKVYGGDTWAQSYLFKSGEPTTPIDFVAEGWGSWKCQWRPVPGAKDFIELAVDDSQSDVGRIVIEATATQTAEMNNGFLDLQATNNGEIRTWLTGQVVWREDVTK